MIKKLTIDNCELILSDEKESLYIEIDGKRYKIGWWYFMDHPSYNVDTNGDLDFLRYRVQSYLIDGKDDDFEDTFCHSETVKSEIIELVNSVLSR